MIQKEVPQKVIEQWEKEALHNLIVRDRGTDPVLSPSIGEQKAYIQGRTDEYLKQQEEIERLKVQVARLIGMEPFIKDRKVCNLFNEVINNILY